MVLAGDSDAPAQSWQGTLMPIMGLAGDADALA